MIFAELDVIRLFEATSYNSVVYNINSQIKLPPTPRLLRQQMHHLAEH